ncbi:MAG: GGDEF domain-containing protein [Kiloniellales bacterium]|nr:GGDEF domain-containing protein [Kiloniellales bacterium]
MTVQPERTSEAFGTAALKAMKQLEIPANPQNYAVWFTYESGSDPELKRTLDGWIEQKLPFTQERCEEAYQRFFQQNASLPDLGEVSQGISQAIESALSDIGEAEKNASQYGLKLVKFSGSVAAADGCEDIKSLVTAVAGETRRMEERNRALEQRLRRSSEHIVDLNQKLADVTKEAMTDSLTGLANRKCFDLELRRATRSFDETGQALCLMFLDIDHFKKFNDTHGHQVGDLVLKLVASFLRNAAGSRDTPARYGGEEFAIVMPKAKLPEALRGADVLRRAISSKNITRKSTGEQLGRVTVSIGIAEHRSGDSPEELVERADLALYAAKNKGRNCVSIDTMGKGSPNST